MYGEPPLTVRPRIGQLVPQLLVGSVGLGVAAVRHDRILAIAVGLAMLYLALVWRTHGTHVNDHELVLLGLRSRRIPWEAVADLREQRAFGGRGLLVAETSGRHALLPAPRDSRLAPNRDYEHDRDAVLDAWQRSRDDSWRADRGS